MKEKEEDKVGNKDGESEGERRKREFQRGR